MKTYLCNQLGDTADYQQHIAADTAQDAASEFARRHFDRQKTYNRTPTGPLYVVASREVFAVGIDGEVKVIG